MIHEYLFILVFPYTLSDLLIYFYICFADTQSVNYGRRMSSRMATGAER